MAILVYTNKDGMSSLNMLPSQCLITSGEAGVETLSFSVSSSCGVNTILSTWPSLSYQCDITKLGVEKRCTVTHSFVVFIPHGCNKCVTSRVWILVK